MTNGVKIGAKVAKVIPNPKNPKQGFVHFDVGEAAWSPDYEAAKKLEIGKPPPEGWLLRDGPKGKQLLPPGEKRGGGSNWYNSEAGVRFIQERTDRRTALMQAVATYPNAPGSAEVLADTWYEWLRKNLDVPEGPRVSTRERGSAGAGTASAQGPPSGTSGEEGASVIVNPPSTEHSPETPEGAQGPASPPSRRSRPVENQP